MVFKDHRKDIKKIVIGLFVGILLGVAMYFLTQNAYSKIKSLQEKLNGKYFTLELQQDKESFHNKFKYQCPITNLTTPEIKIRNYVSNNRTLIDDIIRSCRFLGTNISFQQIDFNTNNFTTSEISYYRMKETYNKYWKSKRDQKQVIIKVFDLKVHKTYQSLKKYLEYTVHSINYLADFQTGPLFWIQSKQGKWKSLKKRNQNNKTEIINFILVNEIFRLKLLKQNFNIKNVQNYKTTKS